MPTKKEKFDVKKGLEELQKIYDWFDKNEDANPQEQLAKIKEAAPLIKQLRAQLKDIENEFIEVKKDLDLE
ncbi:MAG: hypothetical protein COT81_03120 [Candidatus Buchananbacteria bacterium CG10_big_fil_rev_8_21_14_0_10_42_9]|uniref:Uncharacterized protein n=1 Tax=Candidatus Buchananbacteria bacterium CG10_big_fil_rev_8_21_14_0_10_42_9 TaxID=1974526 RepID=A0A2H0W335_9BACT|nr:MAG: hypothetical protein COT81_03120 [Candidatus Buchananbacteria bacterium CG10_big_fil_rev_8_21_14_0_10_42_9]